jgi:hypothetical protein
MKNLTNNQDPDGVESVLRAHHWLILMPPNMVNAVDGHSSHLRRRGAFSAGAKSCKKSHTG